MVRVAALLAALFLCVSCSVMIPSVGRPADALGWPAFPDPPATALGGAEAAAYQAVINAFADVGRSYPGAVAGASGVSAAVVGLRGSWSGAAGVDGRGARLTPDSVMGLGTLTATVTAAEVLHLAGQGRIDLDAPLAAVVPGAPVGPEVTVRQVLAMRSGLGDLTTAGYADLAAEVRRDPTRAWTRADLLVRRVPPATQPQAWSGLGYLLLADAVERVSGSDFASAVRRDLLDPAGLPDVVLGPGGALAAPGPDGVLDVVPTAPPRALAGVALGATGFAADAADVARWGWALYGARVLPPAAVAQMTTPAGPDRIEGRPYGLGTMIFSQTVAPEESFGHRGREPGWTSVLVVEPGKPLAVAVLAIGGGKDLGGVARALFLAADKFGPR